MDEFAINNSPLKIARKIDIIRNIFHLAISHQTQNLNVNTATLNVPNRMIKISPF